MIDAWRRDGPELPRGRPSVPEKPSAVSAATLSETVAVSH